MWCGWSLVRHLLNSAHYMASHGWVGGYMWDVLMVVGTAGSGRLTMMPQKHYCFIVVSIMALSIIAQNTRTLYYLLAEHRLTSGSIRMSAEPQI